MSFAVTVITDSLHMRKGAGQTFDSLGFVSKGAELDALCIDSTGTWLQVKQTGQGGLIGWCSARYLLPKTVLAAPWLTVAGQEIGVKQYPGKDTDHPRIQTYLSSVNDLNNIDKLTEETPWCSCFINWCVEQTHISGTDSAWARSWGNWRETITLDDAKTGDIAVFDRITANTNGGHVGIFIETDSTTGLILVLGGNQSNAVRYSWYPTDGNANNTRYSLLSCRRAKSVKA